MGKILQGSNITITSWARSYREKSNPYTMGKIPPGELSNHYTMGKILQESNLTTTPWTRSYRGAI
jgi:transposase